MPSVAFIGIPYDAGSTFQRGAAKAPDIIRKSLYSEHTNLFSENGIDLSKDRALLDLGNLSLENDRISAFETIENNIAEIITNDIPLISLGGDHSITYPILKGITSKHKTLSVIQFDAHPDLYPDYKGERYSHASPFARIMEDGLVSSLTQIGIRANTDIQRNFSKDYNIETIGMDDIQDIMNYELLSDNPVYISIDIDCLDPAFAPGVSHPEPGGISVRFLLDLLARIDSHIVGVDIVEYNPDRDINNLTACVCAKLIKEITGKILRG